MMKIRDVLLEKEVVDLHDEHAFKRRHLLLARGMMWLSILQLPVNPGACTFVIQTISFYQHYFPPKTSLSHQPLRSTG